MLRFIFYLFIIFSVSACTTLKPLDSKLSYDKVIHAVKPGDRLVILTKNMKKYNIVVEEVNVNLIAGYEEQPQSNGINDEVVVEQKKKVFVKVSEVKELKVKVFSPAKTVGLAAAVYSILLLVIMINGISGLASSGDPGYLFLF